MPAAETILATGFSTCMKRKGSDRNSDVAIKKSCEQRPGPSASSSVESRKSVPEVDFINDARARSNWANLSVKLRDVFKQTTGVIISTLNLFVITRYSGPEVDTGSYKLSLKNSSFSIDLLLPKDRLSIKGLTGFDNTGNIRIWPGGESLAYFISVHPELVVGKTVLEVGAGFLGLPGLVSSLYASKVVITDGNDISVTSLRNIVSKNSINNVNVNILRWGTGITNDDEKFDVILAADCVFFPEYHDDLLTTFDVLLSHKGVIYISSPKRKGSFDKFIDRVNTDGRFESTLELLKAIQVGVLKTSDDVLEQFKGDGVTEFDPEVLSRVGALLWDTLVDDWTSDLLGFSAHANRVAINTDDVSLIMRRNDRLLKLVSERAGIGETEGVVKKQRSNARKRKNQATVVPIACSTPLKEEPISVSVSQSSLLQITPISLTSQIPFKMQSIAELNEGKENDSFEDEPMFMENLPINRCRSNANTAISLVPSNITDCVPNSNDCKIKQVFSKEGQTFVATKENSTIENDDLLIIEKSDVKSLHGSSSTSTPLLSGVRITPKFLVTLLVVERSYVQDSFDEVFSFDQTLTNRYGNKRNSDPEKPFARPQSPDIFDTPLKAQISSTHNDSFEDSVALSSSSKKKLQANKANEKPTNQAKTKESEWSTSRVFYFIFLLLLLHFLHYLYIYVLEFAAFSFIDSITTDETNGNQPLENKGDVKVPIVRTPKTDRRRLHKRYSLKSDDSKKVMSSSSSRIGDLLNSFDGDDDIDFSQLD
uniref:Calmodulin-lysine N-methyltransferase n=1 Tax=Heterorhabditis bacteriophora TaxID=37862 RepID=A0A1I7X3R5_HETBA